MTVHDWVRALTGPFWLGYADSTEVIDAPAGATRWSDLSNVCRPIDGSMVIVGVRPIRLS